VSGVVGGVVSAVAGAAVGRVGPVANGEASPVARNALAEQTRREFMARSGSTLSGIWLMRFAPLIAAAQACATEAMNDGSPFTTFTPREGADLEAFSARIVPTDDTAGAREAGSVYFADQASRASWSGRSRSCEGASSR
jgi:hypothetical protein